MPLSQLLRKARFKANSTYVFLAALTAVIILWRIFSPPRSLRLELLSTLSVKRQNPPHNKRVWMEPGLRLLHTLGDITHPISPMYLQVSKEGNLIFYDAAGSRIDRLSPSGDLVTSVDIRDLTLKAGIIPVVDLIYNTNGSFWLAHPSSGIIYVRPGEAPQFVSRRKVLRMVGLENNLLVALFDSPNALGLFDTESGAYREFGKFVSSQKDVGIFLNPLLAADEHTGSFFYVPDTSSFFACYSRAGEERYVVSTIDGNPLPLLFYDDSRTAHASSPQSFVTAVHAVDGFLYIMITHSASTPNTTTTTHSSIDVYRASDGAYLHSFMLPDRYLDFAIDKGLLYLANGTSVQSWALSQ